MCLLLPPPSFYTNLFLDFYTLAATIPNFLSEFGKHGLPPQYWTDENGKERTDYKKLILNWNVEDSSDLIARFKKKGMKPYSGMAFVAIKAWEQTFGYLPKGMMQQASLQIRGYVPHYSERNLCGDWLIGPIHRISSSKQTYEYQDAIIRCIRDKDRLWYKMYRYASPQIIFRTSIVCTQRPKSRNW